MSKRLALLILVFLMSVVSAASGVGAGTARQTLLRDGFVLRGVDGKLTSAVLPPLLRLRSKTVEAAPDSSAPIREPERGPKLDWCGSGWFFELGSDVSDYRARAGAGTRLELLPSATLEKMTTGVNERSVRLWGRITKYKRQNFIFPMYFLPLTKTVRPQSQTPKALQKPQQQEGRPVDRPSAQEDRRQPAINDPNDILEIPQEIIEKLKTKKADRPKMLPETTKAKKQQKEPEPAKRLEIEQDSILADRTALLVRQDDGQPVFVLDALGRNVQQVSLRLLPCEALELTERRQAVVPEPVRFKIAGIKTAYEGNHYLLLQKATRVYSHQNFDR
ncbi:MAG: hypothetical protein ACYTBX_06170 [Planctomycetota bacterium]|jgi:hypothetical protein